MELILQQLSENTFDFSDCSDGPSKGRCTPTYVMQQIQQEQQLRLVLEDHLFSILCIKFKQGFYGQHLTPITCNKLNITFFFPNYFHLLLVKIHIFHSLQARDGCRAHHSHTTQVACLKPSPFSVKFFSHKKY